MPKTDAYGRMQEGADQRRHYNLGGTSRQDSSGTAALGLIGCAAQPGTTGIYSSWLPSNIGLVFQARSYLVCVPPALVFMLPCCNPATDAFSACFVLTTSAPFLAGQA